MPYFNYKAKDAKGTATTGLVEAPTEEVAARLIKEKKLFILSLTKKNEGSLLTVITDRFRNISFKDVVNFTRQMSTLSVAGLSIPESLTIIRSQTKNPALLTIYSDIENSIISGGNLATALTRHPKVFNPVYVALIKAGEASGSLDKVLTRMAESLENQLEFRAKLKGAMIYPAIIVIGMIGVVFVMMTVVVPKMTELYSGFGIDLPFTTRLLISISNLFVNFWWLMIIGGAAGIYGFNRWKKTLVGQIFIDTIMLKMPIFGELRTKVILSEFTRTLGMLITAGIHILDALHFLKDSVGNVLYSDAIGAIATKIEKGMQMGDSFAQYEVFPGIVSQMIKVGEETGKLDETLQKLSTYFEREADHLLKNLTTAMEPLIMVVLGLGVGFIVFSIITPIYSLTTAIK
jgi:type II secretory pathway component PulF